MSKKVILIIVLLIFGSLEILIARPRTLTGGGVVVGAPTGINFKHYTGKKTAVECDFSVVSNKLYLVANYLYHDFSAFGKVEEGELALFYGFSGGVYGNHVTGGGAIGVAYIFDNYPFDIFIKLVPAVIFERNVNLTFIGGIGGRYFFR